MTTNHQNQTTSGDEVDRLLTAFYRSEMPAHWPDAPRPWAETAHVARTADPRGNRSRWALAASVALLIGGCWYLSGQMTDGRAKRGLGLDEGSANPPKVLKDHLPKPDPKMP
jgi:hypothetical protein